MRLSFPAVVLTILLATCATARAALAPIFTGPVSEEHAAKCETLPAARVQACKRIYAVPALRFPSEVQVGAPVKLEMSIHRPPGPGPFPTLILLHTCAPLAQNPQVRRYAEAGLRAGYAVFLLDSFGQRGLGDNCYGGPIGPIQPLRARDAAEALLHLKQFDWVDMHRVAAIGFSQGARVMYWLARDETVPFYTGGLRFAALVSMYGECYNRVGKADYVHDRSNVPLLALLGDLDEDGDPRECVPRLARATAAGAPFEWHVFHNAAHSWDNENFVPGHRNQYKGAPSGSVLQAYDAGVAAQAEKMTFEFLQRVMPAH
jgi:dienelactone hydrolase